jgi:hypothetical protein
MERERIGVSTQDLSVRWHDTLGVWRERPRDLGEDADAESFRFSGRRHSWVLFRRGYLLRLPDWIAVHQGLGAVRRFANVSEPVVWAALQGDYAAHQHDLEKVWGRSRLPYDRPQYVGGIGVLNIGKLISACGMPIYGLGCVDSNFQLRSVSWSEFDGRIVDVDFIWTGSLSTADPVAFRLGSSDVRDSSAVLSGDSLNTDSRIITRLQKMREFGVDVSLVDGASSPRVSEHMISIDGNHFKGQIVSGLNIPGYHFVRFESALTTIRGDSYGFGESALIQLLGNRLAMLNERQDLIEQYQQQLEHSASEMVRKQSNASSESDSAGTLLLRHQVIGSRT